MSNTIYLDYNSTAPMKGEVKKAVTNAFDIMGNPSSIHSFGRQARSAIEKAREQVASFVNARSTNVIFTGSATEANNTILNGLPKVSKILISAAEHLSVKNAHPDAVEVSITENGLIDLDDLKEKLSGTDHTNPALFSVHAVNSETGVIQPIREIAKIVHEHGGYLHTDAVQAAGRIEIDYLDWGTDFMTLSAHKMAGPIGAGAIIAADLTPFEPFIKGGGQEKRRRAGTENIPAIVGFGVACDLAKRDLETYKKTLLGYQVLLEDEVRKINPQAIIVSKTAPRVVNTSNIISPNINAQQQIMFLDLEDICISSGSACSSGSVTLSHVLKAMGYSDELSACSIRVSTGWNTTEDEIHKFLFAYKKMLDSN